MSRFAAILEECELRQKAGNLEQFLTIVYAARIPEPGKEVILDKLPTSLAPRFPILSPDTNDLAFFGVTMIPLLATLTTVSFVICY